MADDDKSTTKPGAKGTTTPAPKAPTEGSGNASGTTPAIAEELRERGVNPALDNRTGSAAPQKSAFAPKPQQFPGPEVGETATFRDTPEAAAFLSEFGDPASGEPGPVGSYGPHGRGDRMTHDAGPDGNPAK